MADDERMDTRNKILSSIINQWDYDADEKLIAYIDSETKTYLTSIYWDIMNMHIPEINDAIKVKSALEECLKLFDGENALTRLIENAILKTKKGSGFENASDLHDLYEGLFKLQAYVEEE